MHEAGVDTKKNREGSTSVHNILCEGIYFMTMHHKVFMYSFDSIKLYIHFFHI